MLKMSVLKAALVASVAMAVTPAAVLAQVSPVEGEAEAAEGLVVIGQRQQYRGDVPLSAIPQSVQVIDAKTLQDLNITRLDNALDLSSGISRQNNFGGLFDGFAIRGFAGDENFPGGILVNGFNGGRGYGGPRDASNIEKIEILKGPNGAVFGRGEPGGTINIITKKARLDDSFGSFALQGGSFNTFRVEGDYNLALSDTVAIRLNGAMQDGDSFRDNIEQTLYVATPSILFAPSQNTSFTYELEFVENRIPFDRGVLAVNGQLGVIPNSRFLGEPGDGPMRVGVLGHQFQFQQKLGGDWYFLAGLGYRETEFEGFSTEAELDPLRPNGTPSNARQTLGKPGNFLARQRRFRDYTTSNTVLRGELSGKFNTGALTHHVLIGADWDRFKIDLLQLRGRPGIYTRGAPVTAANNAVDIFNPVYGQLLPATAVLTNTEEVQKAYGIYFQDQVDLTDRLKLRFGGRYDNFRQTILNRANNRTNIAAQERFSPTAGLLYEVTEQLSVYGGYGEGFRPNSGTDAALDPFPAELSKSYEIGMRYGAPGDVISGTIAAFTMNKNNILTSDPNPNNAGFSFAGGAARSRGIELDVNASLPGGVMVIATYAYLDAEWTTSSLDRDFGFAGLTINPGDRLINIPKHAANLIVSKGFMIGDQRFTFGGGINYVGERLGETAATFELPGYVVARLMATYEPAKNVRITGDVTNLFDKQFYTASYSSFWVAPGAPRAFNIRATFSF